MTTFSFLARDHTVLTGPYGVTRDSQVAEALSRPLSAGELFQLEQRMPGRVYNEKRSRRLERFITRYVRNRNEAGRLSHLAAVPFFPPQFWSHGDDAVFYLDNPIHEVVITELTWLYADDKLEVVRSQEVARFKID